MRDRNFCHARNNPPISDPTTIKSISTGRPVPHSHAGHRKAAGDAVFCFFAALMLSFDGSERREVSACDLKS
jgi:hypothetical protein